MPVWQWEYIIDAIEWGTILAMKKKRVVVNNAMQKGYVYYLTEPMGKHFDEGFTPMLTPKQMLSLGVFSGVYMRDTTKEYPKDWFTRAKFAPGAPNPSLNFFKIKASTPLSYWRAKGWIHTDDPRGWFEWYCRYYMGRRHEDDARQIRRWRQMRRHIAQVQRHCRAGDLACRPRQRQALLHFAYDSRVL